ncbi:hypothetical protein [Acaryochloris sp. IP29b_bin.137]|uniref:hypothetical protein n=1 Tax=Acaryochloris sp. IP29b_bin.137 TaxID=2969217 RepID=UPI00261E2910|nr:hypothetical protein [Acaryochloris sp. IP29b_bin.137]
MDVKVQVQHPPSTIHLKRSFQMYPTRKSAAFPKLPQVSSGMILGWSFFLTTLLVSSVVHQTHLGVRAVNNSQQPTSISFDTNQ